MTAWCDVCHAYHGPRPAHVCRARAGRSKRRGPRGPASPAIGIGVGLIAGVGAGNATNSALVALGTFAVVAAVVAGIIVVTGRSSDSP